MDSTEHVDPPPGLFTLICMMPLAVLAAVISGPGATPGVVGAKITCGTGDGDEGNGFSGSGTGDDVPGLGEALGWDDGDGPAAEGDGLGAEGSGAGLLPEDNTRSLHRMDPAVASGLYILTGRSQRPSCAPTYRGHDSGRSTAINQKESGLVGFWRSSIFIDLEGLRYKEVPYVAPSHVFLSS